MNIESLSDDLCHLTVNGVSLAPAERMQVQLAITQLQLEMKLEEAYFWGKIEGK